ncbi:MAG: SRPBCC family protein [Cyanobacteria bacterium J06627_28]
MMSLIQKGVAIVFALAAIIFLGGFILPSQVHVERQTIINAPASAIFAEVSDFNEWSKWSPWANIDPNVDYQLEGKGIGQTMTWASDNPDVGSGKQTITQLESPQLIKTRLDFGDMGVSEATLTLEPIESKTRVTWSLDTDMREGVPLLNKPISTYVGFFMDSMVGSKYAEGLENLKAVVEG